MEPRAVLVCPPDHFDVVDVKNPFMVGRAGSVDPERAREQWTELCAAFAAAGMAVETIEPLAGCEDMVFTANPCFTGLDARGKRLCVLSHMKHASRAREVPAHLDWFGARGYRVVDPMPETVLFEGGGDALWHPGRRAIWAGAGPRTDRAAHPVLAEAFGAVVHTVELGDPRFYHLDTCLCPLDERTALVFPPALGAGGLAKVRGQFERVHEVDEEEAVAALACNAAAFPSSAVVIDFRARRTTRKLADWGYRVLPVDTGEFLKSGGSVFCLKQLVF